MLATCMQVADAVVPAQPHEALTLTLSSLHISKPDMERVRTRGWPLPYEIAGHTLKLTLPSRVTDDSQLQEFLVQLCRLGYSGYIADFVRWACTADYACLELDDFCEPSDRLPIFVG